MRVEYYTTLVAGCGGRGAAWYEVTKVALCFWVTWYVLTLLPLQAAVHSLSVRQQHVVHGRYSCHDFIALNAVW